MVNKKILIGIMVLFVLAAIGGYFLLTQNIQEISSEETITISGSGSGIAILKLLEEPFVDMYPKIHLNFLPATSTDDAIKGVAKTLIDIGATARKMKNSEKEQYLDITELIYVRDAMILGVNPNVNITSLTKEQIRKIYTGEITDWKEIGGQQGEIIVLDREESDSSKILLRREILANLTVTSKATILFNADTMNKVIEDTENAIGQSSLGVVTAKKLKIKPIGVEGVMPSVETIRDGSYSIVRDYGVIIPKSESKKAVKLFVDFIFSKEAQQTLEQYKFLCVSMEKK